MARAHPKGLQTYYKPAAKKNRSRYALYIWLQDKKAAAKQYRPNKTTAIRAGRSVPRSGDPTCPILRAGTARAVR